jgi:hypothetical protein
LNYGVIALADDDLPSLATSFFNAEEAQTFVHFALFGPTAL